MNEILLLRLLLKNTLYNKYIKVIDLKQLKENNKELHFVFKSLISLHEKFPERNFNLEELRTFFFTEYPDAKKDIYDGLFTALGDAEVSEDIADSILAKVLANQQAIRLSEKAFEFTQGRSSIDDLRELVESIQTTDKPKVTLQEENNDLEALLNSALKEEGLRWRLEFLNKSLGSVREGDFGFLFKRPESGGTAFCASEAANFFDQTDRPIVWINNEEANDKVMLRVYQAYFGVTVAELLGNSERFRAEFKERVGNKFKFFGIDRSNKKDIETIVDFYKPRVVLYDQLDKVQGFEADREDLKLGAIYEWARNLTKKGHTGIGITQADGSAEGVMWLNMSHVANAKTSKQAEADFIIGLGKSNEPNTDLVRYISICKNKLLGSPDSIPRLRHGRQEVLIEPQIMRLRDFDYMKYE